MSDGPRVWAVGEPIPFTIEIIDPATGLGHVGATPTLRVQRASDGAWWGGAEWGVDPAEFSPAELDAVNLPGVYRYWLPSSANAAADIYTGRGVIDDSTVTSQRSETHVSRVAPTVGLYEAVVQVRDNLGAAVPFARVAVYDGSGTAFITELVADASGNATPHLPALSAYSLRCASPGYSFAAATSFTLFADGQVVPVVATALTLPQSVDPAMCTVSGWLRSAGGPHAGARVRVRFAAPQTLGDDQLTRLISEYVTDAAGAWTMELPRLAVVELSSPEAGLDWVRRTVSDSPTSKWVLLS
jgi:hypothetical protein